jgi:hypothetical protein
MLQRARDSDVDLKWPMALSCSSDRCNFIFFILHFHPWPAIMLSVSLALCTNLTTRTYFVNHDSARQTDPPNFLSANAKDLLLKNPVYTDINASSSYYHIQFSHLLSELIVVREWPQGTTP